MTHLATESGSNRSADGERPAAPGTQPRTAVRLPDLSGARKSIRIDNAVPREKAAIESAATLPEPRNEPSTTLAPSTFYSQKLIVKVAGIVRQPKFWLACVVFVAVQVILALVVPPNKEESAPVHVEVTDGLPPAESAPAARIVVPAAPASNDMIEPAATEGVMTPMGAAVGGESDARTSNDSAILDEAGLAAPPTRMADQRGLGDAGQFDGRKVEVDGATLGGIVPLAPTPHTGE